MTDEILRFLGVNRTFAVAAGPYPALRDVDAVILRRQVVALTGRSGSGKSTLLHLAAGIDVPSSGAVLFEGVDLARLTDAGRTRLRRDAIGLVFQFFHLLPHLSVRDNVALPELIAGAPLRAIEGRVHELLARVGLEGRARDPAGLLSGGEQQRVALCRALVRRPRLVLADEPTGNLDDENGRAVMDLLLELVTATGATLVFATHSADLARRADVRFHLHSGVLEGP